MVIWIILQGSNNQVGEVFWHFEDRTFAYQKTDGASAAFWPSFAQRHPRFSECHPPWPAEQAIKPGVGRVGFGRVPFWFVKSLDSTPFYPREDLSASVFPTIISHSKDKNFKKSLSLHITSTEYESVFSQENWSQCIKKNQGQFFLRTLKGNSVPSQPPRLQPRDFGPGPRGPPHGLRWYRKRYTWFQPRGHGGWEEVHCGSPDKPKRGWKFQRNLDLRSMLVWKCWRYVR